MASLVDFLVALTEREFEEEALLLADFELTVFAARDDALAEALNAWHGSLLADLAEALETLGAERPFEAARTVLQLVRGYEQDLLTRREVRSEDLRRRLSVVIGAFVGAGGASGRGRPRRRAARSSPRGGR